MSLHSVLNEDWSEYDDRKKRGGADHRNFACTEQWEADDLIRKIDKQHPNVSKEEIRNAITACCKQIGAPHPRVEFVACVMKRLDLG